MQRLLKRLNRVGLLIRCLALFLSRGKADKIPERFRTIVVVITGKLGDVVCGTPVLRAIRSAMPHVHIIVAGPMKIQKPVLADSGLVDEFIDLDEGDSVMKLRNANADAAFITGPSFIPTATAFAAGIPLVVSARVVNGASPSETKPYNLIKKLVVTFPYDFYGYAPAERLKVLEPIGIRSTDTEKHLGFSENAKSNVEKFFSENHIDIGKDFVVAISPSAGNKIKEWPTERFAQVASHLVLKHKAKVVIIGGPKDNELVSQTVSHLNAGTTVVTATHFSVDELKAFMSMIHLFIAVDTGPIYVAEAFGVPTVDIVGPVDENIQPPRGSIHKNVVPKRERAQLFILNARSYDHVEAERQTKSISPEEVITVVDELVARIK